MCEKCNDSLIAAANAVSLLAAAAKDLYSINMTRESATLAKAAAALFTEVKQEGGVNGEASAADAALEDSARPAGFHIYEENGVIYCDGVAIARIVRTGKTTQH